MVSSDDDAALQLHLLKVEPVPDGMRDDRKREVMALEAYRIRCNNDNPASENTRNDRMNCRNGRVSGIYRVLKVLRPAIPTGRDGPGGCRAQE